MSARPSRPAVTCTGCGKATRSAMARCRACQTGGGERPARVCPQCGTKHRARRRDRCADCAGAPARGKPVFPGEEPSASHALVGGRWVIEGRVQRWKPWTDEERRDRDRRARRMLRSAA